MDTNLSEGKVIIYCGYGRGKSAAALGMAFAEAAKGKNAFVIRYLKGAMTQTGEFLKKLEPELKVFQFEKLDSRYEDLSPEEKKEAEINIINGFNFARKVIVTGECGFLALDEILGLVDTGLIKASDLKELILKKPANMILVLTGRTINSEIAELADEIIELSSAK